MCRGPGVRGLSGTEAERNVDEVGVMGLLPEKTQVVGALDPDTRTVGPEGVPEGAVGRARAWTTRRYRWPR